MLGLLGDRAREVRTMNSASVRNGHARASVHHGRVRLCAVNLTLGRNIHASRYHSCDVKRLEGAGLCTAMAKELDDGSPRAQTVFASNHQT